MKIRSIGCLVAGLILIALTSQAETIQIDFNDNFDFEDPGGATSTDDWNVLNSRDTVTLYDTNHVDTPIQISFFSPYDEPEDGWNPGSSTYQADPGYYSNTVWDPACRDFFTSTVDAGETNLALGYIVLDGFGVTDVATVRVVVSHSIPNIVTFTIDEQPSTGDHDGLEFNMIDDGYDMTTGGKIMEWVLTGKTSYKLQMFFIDGLFPTGLINAMEIVHVPGAPLPTLRLDLLPGPATALRWEAEASNYVAQSAAILGGEEAWADVPGTPVVDGPDLVLTNAPLAADPAAFYRLELTP